MKNGKFEYFLNAIYYCIWLNEMSMGSYFRKRVNMLFSPIPKYLFTKSYREKYYERLPKEREKAVPFFNNRENGYYIGRAKHWFSYLCSGYSAFFSFLLLGIALREWSGPINTISLIVLAIPILLGDIPVNKAVFANDRYLKYFKQFEKEDEQWHRKWKRITLAFEIGSIVAISLGIGAAFFIVIVL